MSIQEAAQSGFHKAELYDKHRPSYDSSSVQKVLERIDVAGVNKAWILDLGAGTGKFTECLASRPEEYEIVAVEPHAKMRQQLANKNLSKVKTLDGDSTKIGLEDNRADAVVVAQAFHWFANMESLLEIHRVLTPGGVLGLIWNVDDYNAPEKWEPSTTWESKLKELIWSHPEKDPRYRNLAWPKIFDEQLKSSPATIQLADPLFSLPLGEDETKWSIWLSREAIWARFRTISHMAVLEGQQLEDTKKAAFEAMHGDDAMENEKGELELHGRTVIHWTTAIPGAPLKSGG